MKFKLLFILSIYYTFFLTANGQVVWHTGIANQQLAAGSGTTYTITKPTNIVAGDLVILILTQQRSSSNANTSSFIPTAGDGFTLITASNSNNNDRTSVVAYGKIASAADLAILNYTGTVTQFSTTTPNWKATVTRVTGHDVFNPVGPNNVGNALNTTNVSIPQISIPEANSLLVAARSVRVQTGASNAVPTGMTESSFVNGTTTTSVNASTNAPSFQVATQSIVATGNTGARQFTWTATSANVSAAGLMFSINPMPSLPRITGISTNFNGYWATSVPSNIPIAINNPIEPNNSHELLSFTYNGVRYSTGVNDATLTSNGATFTPGNYRALPVAGLLGSLTSNNTNTLLAMASLKDGNQTQGLSTHPNISGKTIRNVLIDGVRGLDLGTGVTNLPTSSVMSFGIFSIKEDAIADAFPDLLVTQIALPGGNTDTYAFYDAAGVLVGNTVVQNQSSLSQLGNYRLDLFSLTAEPLTNATPWGGLFEAANGTRPIRLSAYKISDFGINASNYQQVAEFRIVPSGMSDLAFMGYNASSINFRPAISADPGNSVSTVCSGGTAILKVIATPANDGVLTYQWQEKIGSNPFTNISDGGSFTGTTTDELRVSNPTANVQYQCIVTETSPFLAGITSTSGIFTIAISVIGDPTIFSHPADISGCAGAPYNLFVVPSGGTGVYKYQWQSGTSVTGPWTNISGATESFLIGNISNSGPAFFRVLISNDGCNGSVTSNSATITNITSTLLTTNNVERCGTGTVTLMASSTNGGSFSWKNTLGAEVGTASSFITPSLNSTTNYSVTATVCGFTTPSQTVTAIVTPAPAFSGTIAGTKVPTGNPITLTGSTITPVSLLQWQKNGINIDGANSLSYTIPVAELTDATTYQLVATNGICPSVNSNVATVTVVVDLYSKAGQDLNLRETWGVETNGSGVVPVTFTNGPAAVSTRADHIFHAMHIRPTAGNIQLAGTFDVENAQVTITPGTTLTAGVFRRLTGISGAFIGSRTSNIAVTGITGNTNASVLYFNQADNDSRTLKSLVNNSTGTTTISSPLRIVDKLTPTSGYIASNGNITLVSDNLGTAKVTERPNNDNNYVTGDVTVERYVPGIGSNPIGGSGRKWRLFTIPVEKPGTNIRYHWAGGQNARNYALDGDAGEPDLDGTIITGHGAYYQLDGNAAKSAGFDWFTGLNHQTVSSLRFYTNDGTNGSWYDQNHYTNLNSQQVNEQGYMLFVRGDRKMASAVNGTGRTTLRPKGTLKMGTVTNTIPSAASKGYVVFGNPYAAPLDMNKVFAAGESGNNSAANAEFHLWDSYLPNTSYTTGSWGNWRVISKDPGGTWVATPDYTNGETFISHIQSGQAVMIRPTAAGGILTIRESHKDENNTTVVPFETEGGNIGVGFGSFSATLGIMDANQRFVTIDGIRAYSRNDFSFTTPDAADVPKMNKFQGAISLGLNRAGKILSIEAIPSVAKSDTLFFHSPGLEANIRYSIKLIQDKMADIGGTVVLKDVFADTETELTNGQTIEYFFTPTASITSRAPNRFYVVIRQSTTLPVILTSARAYKKGTGNTVEWSTTGEVQMKGFEIEKSADGRKFSSAVLVDAKNGIANDYDWFDAQPFTSETFYRIKTLGLNGGSSYSSIMRVKSNVSSEAISIFPNPVSGNNFTVEMNGLASGTYSMLITNAKGEVIHTRNIEFNGGNQAMNIRLGSAALPAGVYMVNISKGKERVKATKLIFE